MDRGPDHDGGHRALVAALAANVAIAAAKLVAFLATGSVVMLAEVAHSLADSSKQVLLFVGRRRARRGPDPDHPLGYGPERYFWAFLVAILLFPLGALWTFSEALEQLRAPHAITHVGWAVVVLLAAVLFESLSLRVAVTEAHRADPRSSLWRFVRRSRDPDVPSVLLEDAGAVVGAGLGLLALAAAVATGDPRWDAVGGLLISALLLTIGGVLAVEFKSLLIGESAAPQQRAAIERAIRGQSGVRRILVLRTLHLSPDELLVLARVTLDSRLSPDAAAEVVDAIRRRLAEVLDPEAIVFVETEPER